MQIKIGLSGMGICAKCYKPSTQNPMSMQNARVHNITILHLFFVIFPSLHIRHNSIIASINYMFYFMLQTSDIILKVIYHLDCFIYTSFFKILIVFLTYAYPVTIYIIIHRYIISMDTYIILVSMYNLFYFILQTSDIPFEVVRHLCSYIYLPVSSNRTCIIMYRYYITDYCILMHAPA